MNASPFTLLSVAGSAPEKANAFHRRREKEPDLSTFEEVMRDLPNILELGTFQPPHRCYLGVFRGY
jgi:hypothetical protein